LAAQLGITIHTLHQLSELSEESATREAAPVVVAAAPLLVRHYVEDDTVFLGDDYLIKGVAGSILWILLCDYSEKKRTSFTNRELRLDPRIHLPDVGDNLEARLVLLRRRLAERSSDLHIDKTARGRFQLTVTRPIELVQIRSGISR
jgi:adenylate cyclase